MKRRRNREEVKESRLEEGNKRRGVWKGGLSAGVITCEGRQGRGGGHRMSDWQGQGKGRWGVEVLSWSMTLEA